jgi:hypothetical protein
MTKHTEGGVISNYKTNTARDRYEFRDTVLIRISRHNRDAISKESKRTKESMSRIVDWAAEEYLDSVRSLD